MEQDNLDNELKDEEVSTTSGTRCGLECQHKYDDRSECGGKCTRLGGRYHDGEHSCSNGSSHNSW